MRSLPKRLKSCVNIPTALYSNFADSQMTIQNLSNFDNQSQIIIQDLSINDSSALFKIKDTFQFILLCDKQMGITKEEGQYLTSFLTNKKILQQGRKIFDNLRQKAYIKIIDPS
jgi:hypothetical protein